MYTPQGPSSGRSSAARSSAGDPCQRSAAHNTRHGPGSAVRGMQHGVHLRERRAVRGYRAAPGRARRHGTINVTPNELIPPSVRPPRCSPEISVPYIFVETLQPRGTARHRTDQRIIDAVARSDVTDHRQPGMQSEAGTETCWASQGTPFVRKSGGRLPRLRVPHGRRCAAWWSSGKGAFQNIHDAVADVFVDRAFVGRDRTTQRFQYRDSRLVGSSGAMPSLETREAFNVGEQNRRGRVARRQHRRFRVISPDLSDEILLTNSGQILPALRACFRPRSTGAGSL